MKQYQSTVPVKQEEEKETSQPPTSLHKPHNNSISTGSALKKILEESSVIFKSAASSESFDLGLEAHRPETLESSRSITPMRLSLNEELRSPELYSSQDSNFSNFKGHNINKRVEPPRPATATHHYLLSRQKDHKAVKNGARKDYVRKKLNDTFKDIAVDSSILNEGRSSYSGKITRRFLKVRIIKHRMKKKPKNKEIVLYLSLKKTQVDRVLSLSHLLWHFYVLLKRRKLSQNEQKVFKNKKK